MELTATSTPVREAHLSELQKRLNEAMQKLSNDHRAVVTMFDVQGCPTLRLRESSEFRRARSDRASFMPIDNCKIFFLNSINRRCTHD